MRASQRIKCAKIKTEKSSANFSTRRLSIHIRRISIPKVDKSVESNDSVSLDDVQKWENEIHEHLNKSNHSDILTDCNRIFIMTESHFSLNSVNENCS